MHSSQPWYHYTVFLTAYADRINNNKRKEDMDMRIEESINAAAGILDTMTDTKVQKTQKAFADFMDNAAKSNVTGVADVNSKNSVDILHRLRRMIQRMLQIYQMIKTTVIYHRHKTARLTVQRILMQ